MQTFSDENEFDLLGKEPVEKLNIFFCELILHEESF